MNKRNVFELIFRNDPVDIKYLIDYLIKKGMNTEEIKCVFRTLFNSNMIEENKGIVTIKNNTLYN